LHCKFLPHATEISFLNVRPLIDRFFQHRPLYLDKTSSLQSPSLKSPFFRINFKEFKEVIQRRKTTHEDPFKDFASDREILSILIEHVRVPQHIPWFGALGRADDAFLLHHFDEASGAVEADLEAALDVADGGLALLEDDFESFLEEGVASVFVEEGGLVGVFFVDEDLFVDVFGLSKGFDVGDDALYFFFGDKGALHADGEGVLGAGEEHVATPQQFFGATMSMMVRLSNLLATMKAMREGILALMRPVMTSMLGR